MSANLKKHLSFIYSIAEESFSEAQLKGLFKILTPKQLKAIREVLVNFLNGNLVVNSKQLKELMKYKSLIRKLATDYKSCKLKYKFVRKFLKFVKNSLHIKVGSH